MITASEARRNLMIKKMLGEAQAAGATPAQQKRAVIIALARDVSQIGHAGTGDAEVSIESQADLETAKPLIEKAYRQVGG
jgi:predicted transport protein